MRKFFATFVGHKLTSADMFTALTSAQVVAAPATATAPRRDHGLGFGVGVYEGHRWFGHNGGAPGANTEFAGFPLDGVAVAVLSDRDPPTGTLMFRAIRSLALCPSASLQ
jgi:CubicO group peptidase (beta-lactamase class C family)